MYNNDYVVKMCLQMFRSDLENREEKKFSCPATMALKKVLSGPATNQKTFFAASLIICKNLFRQNGNNTRENYCT